ncbi:putative uracil-DNA glycosylase,phage-related protein [Cupriavidus taiwanensis]|uniref:Type-4 uracil-DNA glycosylase n=1 Tax=Cupriavidus taiwanensis TaxID=164546 RepID=A0A375BKV7_9BURK|nr:uracil-DNA glycosylase [Cupriavidus taiwanensis]SOY47345.1 putative uracil-DNA glycosylase,phage-related protein [Cupriavidus taiwanensis]
MNRRAQFLEVLGIATEWVPRARHDALAEAVPAMAAAPAAMPVAAAPVATTAAPATPAVAGAVEAAKPLSAPAVQPAARAPVVPSLVPAGPAPGSAQVEREAAIAAMEWPALDAAVAGCTACGLCQTRTNTVFGVGDRQAEWMLVGEAPGENEDLQGEPFVGQAGKLLDNMLGALGLARGRNVFIANVLKCRPPGNRNPEAEEVAQCEPFLRRQIALVRPRVIVVLGRFAAQSLLRTTTPIGKLRGTVHAYQGIPVVVTYHPAYLLRTLTDKARAWEDLCLAREVHDRAGAGA